MDNRDLPVSGEQLSFSGMKGEKGDPETQLQEPPGLQGTGSS